MGYTYFISYHKVNIFHIKWITKKKVDECLTN